MLVTPSPVSLSPLVGNPAILRRIHAISTLTTSQRHYAKPAPRDELRSPAGAACSWPHPIASSDAVTVHKSGFQGHATALTSAPASLEGLFARLVELYPRTKRATHCMYAWRTRPSVGSSTNIDGTAAPADRGGVLGGSSDGGESGAGERLARLLELGGCEDVVVVVYRWYGGVQLGSERWKCISGVAKEALRAGGFIGSERQGVDKDRDEQQSQAGKKSKRKR